MRRKGNTGAQRSELAATVARIKLAGIATTLEHSNLDQTGFQDQFGQSLGKINTTLSKTGITQMQSMNLKLGTNPPPQQQDLERKDPSFG